MTQLRKIVAYLVVQNQPSIKDPIPIYQGENSFGRNPLKAQVCLPDASVSQKHAKILANSHGITLTDIGSKNGTCVDNMQNKLQKNQSCQIKEHQTIFFAEFKCHFVMSKEGQHEQTLSQTENQEPEPVKIKQQKKQQKPKKSKTLEPKRKKQQKKLSPLKNQQELPIQESTKNSEKLKGNKNNKKNNKEVQQKSTTVFDETTQHQNKNKIKQDATKDLNRQNKNKKKNSKQKTTINNESKQQQTKADQKKNQKQRNSKEKQQVKQKQPQKKVKFSKTNKQHGEQQDGTKIKSKVQEPKQSRKRVPSQQAVQQRISITRRRFAICTRFMISGFVLTISTHQQLKFVQDINQQFDVLVMDKYSRTFKLLYAISKGLPIVTKDWLLQSQFYKKPMSPSHYLLSIPQDKSLIKKSIEKVNEGFRLLSNSKFYLVCDHEKYHLKVSQIQKLIYAMDGEMVQAINPDKDTKAKNSIKNAFMILSRDFSKEDLQKARQLNKDKIYTIQLILQGCLKQELDLQTHKIQ